MTPDYTARLVSCKAVCVYLPHYTISFFLCHPERLVEGSMNLPGGVDSSTSGRLMSLRSEWQRGNTR